jgi:hypothetical protein
VIRDPLLTSGSRRARIALPHFGVSARRLTLLVRQLHEMRRIATILLMCPIGSAVLFACVRRIVPTCNVRNDLVESVIAAKAKELKGQEYCQFRHYQTLFDIDKDGNDDFIVLFTVEGVGGGSNNHYPQKKLGSALDQ